MPSTDQYDSLVAVRNIELETYWNRYNIQFALNGGLLVLLFSRRRRVVELVQCRFRWSALEESSSHCVGW